MDNQNLNPQPNPSQDNKFPAYDSMKKKSHKHPHLMYTCVIITAMGLGLMLFYLKSDLDFVPVQVGKINANRQVVNEVKEVDSVNVGDVNLEFKAIDSDLNSL